MYYETIEAKKSRCIEIARRGLIINQAPWIFFDDQPEYKTFIRGIVFMIATGIIPILGIALSTTLPKQVTSWIVLLGLISFFISCAICLYESGKEPEDVKEFKRLRAEIEQEQNHSTITVEVIDPNPKKLLPR